MIIVSDFQSHLIPSVYSINSMNFEIHLLSLFEWIVFHHEMIVELFFFRNDVKSV